MTTRPLDQYIAEKETYWQKKLAEGIQAEKCVRLMREGLEYYYPDAPAEQITKSFIVRLGYDLPADAPTVTETKPDAPEAEPEPPAASEGKSRKLCFRLIKDKTLDLNSRIVFSYLWKWAWMNHQPRKFKQKKVTARRLRRATGFGHPAITKAINTLKARRYIDARLEPYTKDERLMLGKDGKCMYRKLVLSGEGDIRHKVISAFVAHDSPRKHAAYYVQSLGISRATYFRVSSVTTGGNG